MQKNIKSLRSLVNMKLQKEQDIVPKTTIYLITPTYSRYTQKADLTRMSQTLMHVKNIHWVVVEDASTTTQLVTGVLKKSGLKNTQLSVRTQSNLQKKSDDPHWKKHRGVDQRNMGLQWLRKHSTPATNGVVYFADDDNTYSLGEFVIIIFSSY